MTASAAQMWSSYADRQAHNAASGAHLTSASRYLGQQIAQFRSDALRSALSSGLISLDDVFAFPLDWCSFASEHAASQRWAWYRQSTAEQQHDQQATQVIAPHSSLGLFVDSMDEADPTASSSSTATLNDDDGYPAHMEKRKARRHARQDLAFHGMAPASTASRKRMQSLHDHIESSPISLASTPPTSVPPTPMFSVRELSMEPESVPGTPEVAYEQRGDVLQKRRRMPGNINLTSRSSPSFAVQAEPQAQQPLLTVTDDQFDLRPWLSTMYTFEPLVAV